VKTPTFELSDKLYWHLLSRVLFVTILFSTTIILRIYDQNAFLSSTLMFIYVLISSSYVASFIFWVILRFSTLRNPMVFAALQLAWDVLFTTCVIYLTGGVDSIFTFMYLLNILSANILLLRGGGVATAYACCLLYGGLSLLQYHGVLPPLDRPVRPETLDAIDVAIKVITNLSLFLIIAYVAGYITEALHRTSIELRARQSDLEQLNRINSTIVRNLGDGLVLTNANLSTLFRNSRLGRILDHIDDLPERGPLEGALPFLGPQHLEVLRGLQSSKPSVRWEFIHLDRHKKRRHLVVFGQHLPGDEHHEEQRLVLVRDNTEYCEMEERLRTSDKLAALGQLAAGIAHEIRNPLASISGSIQLLSRDLTLAPEDQRLMNIVLREIGRLDSLISDFLIFARPQNPRPERKDLSELAASTVELFLGRRGEVPGPTITTDFCTPLPVMIDERLLHQVLLNLLRNAVEAMGEEGTVLVSTRQRGTLADLMVEDEGPGIPADVVKRIFDPFFTTKQRGTGLGLSIVYQIIEGHGGKIHVENKESRGTRFHVVLPLDTEPMQ